MHRLYVSGPIRARGAEAVLGTYTPAVLQRHFEVARRYAILGWQCGFAVLCPHLNTAWMDGIFLLDHQPEESFIRGDLCWIKVMQPDDVFLLLPGWQCSDGAREELAIANARGTRVVDCDTMSFDQTRTLLRSLQ